MPDNVNHPSHYTANLSGIETIEITEKLGFCLGNAVKYISRADRKWDRVEDLKKASWYITREATRAEENTSQIRQLTKDEIRYVDGSGLSTKLRIALVLILQAGVGRATNTQALYEALRLIDEDLSDE